MSGNQPENLGKRFGDLDALPEELRKLLNVTKLDELEERVVSAIEALDGVATLDEIMVGLYRTYQYIPPDRRFLANKLYRMTKSGFIESVEKRKGVFRLKRKTQESSA